MQYVFGAIIRKSLRPAFLGSCACAAPTPRHTCLGHTHFFFDCVHTTQCRHQAHHHLCTQDTSRRCGNPCSPPSGHRAGSRGGSGGRTSSRLRRHWGPPAKSQGGPVRSPPPPLSWLPPVVRAWTSASAAASSSASLSASTTFMPTLHSHTTIAV